MILRADNTWWDLHFKTIGGISNYIGKPDKDSQYVSYVAIEDNKVVGVLLIKKGRTSIKSMGTIVKQRWQKRGIGLALWQQMIRTEKPKKIVLTAVSDRGLSLINELKRRYRRIRWHLNEGGNRKLRDLRKKH